MPALVVQTGQTAYISALAVTKDKSLLASGSWDKTIKLWDVKSKREIRALKGHSLWISSLSFSSDGKFLVSCGDNEIKLWNVNSAAEIFSFKDNVNSVNTVAFSPDDKMIAGGGQDKVVKIWETDTHKLKYILKGHTAAINSIAFSPDGKFLISGGYDGVVKLWNISNGTEIYTFQSETKREILSLAFSPDGKTIAAGRKGFQFLLNEAPEITIWDVESKKKMYSLLGHSDSVNSVSFSPNGSLIATGSGDMSIKVWAARTGQPVHTLKGHFGAITQLLFTSDNSIISSSGDITIKCWDIAREKETGSLVGHSSVVNSIALSDDEELLASGTAGIIKLSKGVTNTIKLWDLTKGKLAGTIEGHAAGVVGIALNSRNKRLASVDYSGKINVWDIEKSEIVYSLQLGAENAGPEAAAVSYSPNGKILAGSGENREIRLWNAETGKLLKILRGHKSPVNTLAFSPDGHYLASGSGGILGESENVIKVWDVPSGRLIYTLSGHKNPVETVSFNKSGQMLASGSGDMNIKVWQLNSGKLLRTINNESFPHTIIFEDDKTLISGGDDGSVNFWDAADGKLIRRISAHTTDVNSVVLSPRKKILITASADGFIKIWSLDKLRLVANLAALDNDGWAIVNTDGQFDTNKLENSEGIHWISSSSSTESFPLEIFMRDYYEPKLLPRLLKGEKLPVLPLLSELNKIQPVINKITVIPQAVNSDLVDVKVEVESVPGQCLNKNALVSCESGVYDLRLYRDGQLVGQNPESDEKIFTISPNQQSRQEQLRLWRDEYILKTSVNNVITAAAGRQEILFRDIRLPKRTDVSQVEFTAYAFNEDRVKSATSEPVIYKLPQSLAENTKRRAFIVTVGVDATSASNWRLLFAPNGARDIEALLKEKLSSKYEVIPIQLISEYEEDGIVLKQNLATKSNIQCVLKLLAGKGVSPEEKQNLPQGIKEKLRSATPDDLVIVYIASHGYADPKGVFHIVPSDIGQDSAAVSESSLNRCLTTDEQSVGCDAAGKFLRHSISSEELTDWLRSIDVGDMTLILDSCHSGAVSGPNFKPGPMGNRSFGQLSYDKGMRVLAATQVENFAWGALALNDRSFLTYTLTQPIRTQSFDIDLWLGKAEKAVPEIYRREFSNEKQEIQEPVFLNFRRNKLK